MNMEVNSETGFLDFPQRPQQKYAEVNKAQTDKFSFLEGMEPD